MNSCKSVSVKEKGGGLSLQKVCLMTKSNKTLPPRQPDVENGVFGDLICYWSDFLCAPTYRNFLFSCNIWIISVWAAGITWWLNGLSGWPQNAAFSTQKVDRCGSGQQIYFDSGKQHRGSHFLFSIFPLAVKINRAFKELSFPTWSHNLSAWYLLQLDYKLEGNWEICCFFKHWGMQK